MTNVADDEKTGSESGDTRDLGNLENKENSTAGSSSVSDAISAAAATSNSAQTRFSFYDAAEVQLQISGSSSSHQQETEDLKKANRFNFYDAAELEEQQKQLQLEEEKNRHQEQERIRQLQKEREIRQTNERPTPIIPGSATVPASNSAEMDGAAEDILRSLQETEEQRMSILQVDTHAAETPTNEQSSSSTRRNNRRTPSNSLHETLSEQTMETAHRSSIDGEDVNPYEDAIKEALDLLRRHRSPAKSPTVVVTGGPVDMSSPTTHVRLPTPKEHDRLLHMREDDTSEIEGNHGYRHEQDDTQHVGQEEDIADILEMQKLKAKQRQERMAQYASRLQEFKSSLPNNSTDSNLENTNFEALESNRADTDSMSIMSQSTKQRDEEVQKGVEKVLLAILERAHSRGRSQPKQETMNDALLRAMDELLQGQSKSDLEETQGHENIPQLKTKSMDSNPSKVSERSVVDELLAEEEDQNAANMRAPNNSTNNSTSGSGSQGWSSKLVEEEKKLPDSMERVLEEGNHSNDDGVMDKYATEHYDVDGERDIGAEEEDDGHDAQNDSQNMDRVLGPLSKRAGGTTGVVLDIDPTDEENSCHNDDGTTGFQSTLNYVNSNINQKDKPPPLRKYSTDSEKDVGQDADLDVDREAMELMKTLCAHLLPHSIDPSNRLRQAIPRWDEENPNEAGYRIIRLSRSQLRRVEFAFESMIQDFKNTSGNGALDKNASTYDSSFFKDLQEAERLLDKEAKKLQMPKAQSQDAIDFDKSSAVSVDTNYSQNHPDFPGIKPTGKGEMGDLEYFHLPIIFKSHVTGFEPTKDLILEPGNVVAGQYLVENELGSAAFSTAYRCIDLSSENLGGHEEVCLKVIKNTKDFFDQSLDEIKVLELLRQTGQVDENNIVKMKTFFYYREHLVIVTELLRQNLFEFGKFIIDNDEEDYFTLPRLAYMTRQALVALRFVHDLGLVHSDIKPENILLASYSRAKIKVIDFGSSCYLTDRQSSYIQSRSYRAPEVVLGLPYDGKIDVWSLGCVVAEMYTGEVTFQNDSIVSMLSRIDAICGPFPRHMIAQGRQSGRFFAKSGLLYEVVDSADGHRPPGPHDDDSDDRNGLFDIFQPKTTKLSARLGFSERLMDGFDGSDYSSFDSKRQKRMMMTDFVSKLLTIDPDVRPTAEEALQHPWMHYAATLTEEQIKYPSS
eukprot:CAMPEP_0113642822 /NCGR_PEP_ID=MMETSP0017_2-20120614/22499_1 /TAXON_ID=2856 /ORGANISM="Cylindrotheca closterium" /LENGTH=1185 /DNA_ID=CAMNT_0000554271 /DNA_START=286 /DNA_END=3843 /DNA_ORIENTATION=- /assembly_acc=CAM_ASM_000147